ncbi:hypothetical protein PYW07_004501 [Mythimna separata]|uniref:Uncharacterized protein n=1 Tax=Mythimna separata TaxID=271217 RepID=A0AAD8DZ18_MYTSE|nr:hypothetical protein PYW07_004501 [Mythimna separata]
MSAVESPIVKPEDCLHKFTPRETSKVQQHELSKTVYSHITNLHSLLSEWSNNRAKGFRVAKLVRNLNLPECEEDYFPSQMGPLMDTLLDTLNVLKNIVKDIKLVNTQLQALAKLQRSDEPVLVTWSVKLISEKVIVMYEMANKELELLEKATENIGHCRDAHLLAVYAESWRPGTYVCSDHYSYLFSEAGLPPVSCPA